MLDLSKNRSSEAIAPICRPKNAVKPENHRHFPSKMHSKRDAFTMKLFNDLSIYGKVLTKFSNGASLARYSPVMHFCFQCTF